MVWYAPTSAETGSARQVDDGSIEQGGAGGIHRDAQALNVDDSVVRPGTLDKVEIVGEPVASAPHDGDAQQPALHLRILRANQHRLRGAVGERQPHRAHG